MRKIFEKIAGLAKDNIESVLHTFFSMVIMLWLTPLCGWELALFLTLLIGVGKEFIDCITPGNCASHKDFGFDLLGVALALVPILFMK